MSKKIDLTGQRIGRLTVIREVEPNKHGQIQWHCKCDCGNELVVTTYQLRSGRTKSCGCYKKDKSMSHIAGQKFGRLTALYISGKYQRSNVWHCICDCGNETDVVASQLKNGKVKSCGCLLKEYTYSKVYDFTGLVTEDIEVLKRLPTLDTGSVPYECKCLHCGKVFVVTDHALRQECVHSCGCTYGSNMENEVRDYIKSIVPDIRIDSNICLFDSSKHEVDIYLPEYKLAIEVNGSLHHSTEGNPYIPKPKYYHQNKFIKLHELGIRLISIQDVFWGEKIKNLLQDVLLPHKKIFARKCTCKTISKEDANKFFDKFHIQGGNRNSVWHYGLFYTDELISVMSFGRTRYYSDVEIIRYAVKPFITIIGGAKRLFSHFLEDVSPSKVITYSDNNYFNGNVYESLGFKFVKYTTPDYYWFNGYHGILYREECQPKKLKEDFPELYDSTARSVEVDIMLKRKYKRVYRCGNTRWEFVNK